MKDHRSDVIAARFPVEYKNMYNPSHLTSNTSSKFHQNPSLRYRDIKVGFIRQALLTPRSALTLHYSIQYTHLISPIYFRNIEKQASVTVWRSIFAVASCSLCLRAFCALCAHESLKKSVLIDSKCSEMQKKKKKFNPLTHQRKARAVQRNEILIQLI